MQLQRPGGCHAEVVAKAGVTVHVYGIMDNIHVQIHVCICTVLLGSNYCMYMYNIHVIQ